MFKISKNRDLIQFILGLFCFLGANASFIHRDILLVREGLFLILFIVAALFLIKLLKLMEKNIEYFIFLSLSILTLILSGYLIFKMLFVTFTFDMKSETSNSYVLGFIKSGSLKAFISMVISLFYCFSDNYVNKIKSLTKNVSDNFNKIAVLSLILLIANTFLYSPLNVLFSSAKTYDESLKIVISLILFSAIVITALYWIVKIFSFNRKVLLLLLITFLALMTWVYSYLLPGDFGNLDGVILTKAENLKLGKVRQLLELFLIFISFVAFILLFIYKTKIVLPILVILNLMSFGQTVGNIVTFKQKSTKQNFSNTQSSDLSAFKFSKEENVIIIMLDMFCAGYIPELLLDNPELESELKGFTWYPNTISISNNTYTSMPSLIGGRDFTPDSINKKGIDIKEQYNLAYTQYSKDFGKKGYDISFGGLYYIWDKSVFEDNDINYYTNKDIFSKWKSLGKNVNEVNKLTESIDYRGLFMAIGLFKSSPHIFKSRIYSKGKWLKTNNGGSTITHILENFSVLKMLPELSTTDSKTKTVKFFANNLTHMPFGLDEDGKVTKTYMSSNPQQILNRDNNTNYINPKVVLDTYRTSFNLLVDWFNWMKENNVYNNSKIIIVSDHGVSGTSDMFFDFTELLNDSGEVLVPTGRVHPIMMVKEIDSGGDLKVSDLLLSNADTYDIASSVLGKNDPINYPDLNRSLKVFITPWKLTGNEYNKYNFISEFSVSGSVFDKNNWVNETVNGE
ncbi:MAG: hypothetical protein OCD02_01115 [Spirochaetaceae bacterium]